VWGDLAEYDPDIFADVLRSSAEIAAEEIDPKYIFSPSNFRVIFLHFNIY